MAGSKESYVYNVQTACLSWRESWRVVVAQTVGLVLGLRLAASALVLESGYSRPRDRQVLAVVPEHRQEKNNNC